MRTLRSRSVAGAVAHVQEALESPKRDFAIGLALEDGEMRLFDKIEEVAVQDVHLEDAPAAGRPWRSRAPWPSAGLRDQLGQRHQIVGGGSEGSPTDPIMTTEVGLLLLCDRLDSAECFLAPLADAPADSDRVRPSTAELWALVFCATCGVTFIERSSLMKSSA